MGKADQVRSAIRSMDIQRTFSFIDLFAGIGGFRLALSACGGCCLGFSEIDQDAIQTYCKNFSEEPQVNLGDIRGIHTLPPHDFLTAGVPCQSWSIAGKNLGFDDDRGQLWNDTLYLLQQSKPKVFIFENVKGLVDPRNKNALSYILKRISDAGYYADYYVINSVDYGVLQNRIRIYIIGFQEKKFFDRFKLPPPQPLNITLGQLLGIEVKLPESPECHQLNLFGTINTSSSMSLSSTHGFNDYFLFNDIRNGHTTIHSWDILQTTSRQKEICYLLLKNRRKSLYGNLDGNPLSLSHFQSLDPTITNQELDELVNLGILTTEDYKFIIEDYSSPKLSKTEIKILEEAEDNQIIVDKIKASRSLKTAKVPILKTLSTLKDKRVIKCTEIRYDFKNAKISTGLFGISRIFLPSSRVFPTLVSSDTNDYIALKDLESKSKEDYKQQFIEQIYYPQQYRKISQEEACIIQGFPQNFYLPNARTRWMKLLGNSVSVPVIRQLCHAILKTGIFDDPEGAKTYG